MSGTLADEIRARLGELSPAERKVARVLLAGYPAAVFETVATIAERAAVSTPTVLRCATRLGYRGFPDLQAALRAELDERNASPITLYESAAAAPEPEGTADPSGGPEEEPLLDRQLSTVTHAVSRTFREVSPMTSATRSSCSVTSGAACTWRAAGSRTCWRSTSDCT